MIQFARELLGVWQSELLQKIVCFDDFLSEAKAELHTREVGLIASLYHVLDKLKQDLELIGKQWRVAQKNWTDPDAVSLYARLSGVSGRFIPLHQALYWVYTPWAEDETYFMLSSLFESEADKGLYAQLNPTVAFISEFNSVYAELHHYWQTIPGLTEKGSLFALPKISKRDCLMWPLLAHELGHAVYELRSIETTIIPKLIPVGTRRWLNPKILNWTKELVCDLIALHVFGPAYYFAFVESVLFFYCGPVRGATETHPAPWDRCEFMFHTLVDNVETNSIDPKDREMWKEVRFWWSLLAAKINVQGRAEGFMSIMETLQPDRHTFNQIASVVGGLKHELVAQLPAFTKSEYLLAADLVASLRNGNIVASSRPADRSRAAKLLEKSELADEDFEELCREFDERPNKPATIINAAWLLKIADCAALTDSDVPQPVTRLSYGEQFRQRNWQIQKSIETSLLHSMLLQEQIR